MDKKEKGLEAPRKSSNLGFYDDSMHLFQVAIKKELFNKFKAQCALDRVTMKDKLTGWIESSLS